MKQDFNISVSSLNCAWYYAKAFSLEFLCHLLLEWTGENSDNICENQAFFKESFVLTHLILFLNFHFTRVGDFIYTATSRRKETELYSSISVLKNKQINTLSVYLKYCMLDSSLEKTSEEYSVNAVVERVYYW